ncbi:hypothetical protein DFQ27_009436 [Actinomortierella ambigua]|uniref:Uncharacterized protein n=1 Tax=Actinomortierella ambigua TaxID=1343610 RepID=A0A9P6UAX1_9FUNG|nr:hypothetical protein DFQ27_009436 [Actinomortierella ambigua]
MRLQDTPTTRQSLERISGEAHFPCRIFAQTGVIPVTIGLTLLGQGTALTKMSVELWEAVYRLDDNNDSNAERQPLSVRLTSRQNCPLSADWEPSTVDTPSILSKRLLFKVPELPVSTWCKNKDGYTAVPGRGFCHISGEYLCSKIKIEHTLKLVLGYQYEVPVEEDPFRNSRRSSTGGSSISEDTIVVREEIIEAEEKVMIVSHADSDVGHDDAEPPCYYRSFASVPVNPSDIQFIDAAIAQTLHDDPHHPPHGDQHGHAGARLPDYEECIESTSIVGSNNSGNGTRANSIRSLSSMSTREALSGYSSTSSLGHFSMMQETNTGAVSPPLRPSLELHQHRDLSSYIERYSRGEAPSVPF